MGICFERGEAKGTRSFAVFICDYPPVVAGILLNASHLGRLTILVLLPKGRNTLASKGNICRDNDDLTGRVILYFLGARLYYQISPYLMVRILVIEKRISPGLCDE